MDRQSIIGFVLIALVFIGWMIYSGNQTTELERRQQVHADTSASGTNRGNEEKNDLQREQSRKASQEVETGSLPDAGAAFGKWFSKFESGKEETLTVETERYTAVFSSRGGGVKRWTLKGYSTWNKEPLQLIDWSIPSDLNIFFISSDGKDISTERLYFLFKDYPADGRIVLHDSETYSFSAILPVDGDSVAIVKKYTLKSGSYAFDLQIEMRNMREIITNEYQVTICSPNLTELNTVDEAGYSQAYGFVDGAKHTLISTSKGETCDTTIYGSTHWVSVQNKYFLTSLIAGNGFTGSGVFLRGTHIQLPPDPDGERKVFQASIKVKYGQNPVEIAPFQVFIGPMKYDLLKAQHQGLEQTLNLGMAWIVRPFSEYLILPLFNFLHHFVPNYGFVILLFTLLIKLLLYPLTRTSMNSMKKMQALQPMINELREKHKDDQQKLNTETMKLYRDYGINPAGGCLPMLLQMPILFALFTIFRSTIELRQQPFALWISDLSAPDILFKLPFKIPILGTDFISILALLMAVTMFVQQKQTVKDPRQAAMVYMMPAMFWIMFNSFPSGLNLYYFTFNLLSIIQQWYVNRDSGEFQLQKVPQKKGKGWMERAMSNLDEKAKAQTSKRR